MTKTDAPKRRHRSYLFPLDSDQLLPPDLPDVPEEVAEANERAREARQQYAELAAEAQRLREQANAAPNHDRLAAEAAIAAGEPPPKSTAEAKGKAAADAERTALAAEHVAKTRTIELYDAMEGNEETYLAARKEAFGAAQAKVLELVPSLLDALSRLEVEAGLVRAAAGWHNNPNSASLNLSGLDIPEARRRFYEQKALPRARAARRSTGVEQDPVQLLAAIAALAEVV